MLSALVLLPSLHHALLGINASVCLSLIYRLILQSHLLHYTFPTDISFPSYYTPHAFINFDRSNRGLSAAYFVAHSLAHFSLVGSGISLIIFAVSTKCRLVYFTDFFLSPNFPIPFPLHFFLTVCIYITYIFG
jgi:hypothetical protein